jgi:predicted small lipoprotein YifL
MRERRLGILLSIAIMLVATATSMTGCGKKGPLYLPDPTQQQSDDEQSEKKSKKQKQ